MHHLSWLIIVCGALSAGAQSVQTGTPRKLIAADYQKKLLAIVNEKNDVLWQQRINDIHDVHVLANGNILFQTSWTRIVEMDREGRTLWQYDAAKMNGNEGKKVEVHAFQRLADGVTMIAESGPARIIEVDGGGKLVRQVPLNIQKRDPHRDTRLVRKLESGNYLACHEADGAVREYAPDGKVVWEHMVSAAVYSAIRLKNGNTLIGTGNGNSVVEVDPRGKEVWKLAKNDLQGVTLAWITMVQRLPNGNTVVVNCHAGPENPQILEVTPEKKVVWAFKDLARFGNALPVVQLLDEPEARR